MRVLEEVIKDIVYIVEMDVYYSPTFEKWKDYRSGCFIDHDAFVVNHEKESYPMNLSHELNIETVGYNGELRLVISEFELQRLRNKGVRKIVVEKFERCDPYVYKNVVYEIDIDEIPRKWEKETKRHRLVLLTLEAKDIFEQLTGIRVAR